MQPYSPSSGATSLDDLSNRVNLLEQILSGFLGFGTPVTVGLVSGYTPANGTLDNVYGSWVEKTVEPTTVGGATTFTFTHNLNTPTVGSTTPNVRWLVFGYQIASGTSATGNTFSLVYEGGTITKDAINLKFFSSVNMAGATVKVTVFFIPTGG
jgi:hypothetical protein